MVKALVKGNCATTDAGVYWCVVAKKTDIRALIDRTQLYLPPQTLELIEGAFEFVSQSFPDDVEHALQTAITIAELQLDEECIAAALLHEIPTRNNQALNDINERFGPGVGRLVESVVKLAKVTWPEDVRPKKGESDVESHAESLRKMLMAMSEDIRAVFIKLACRLHKMHNLKRMSPAKRQAVAIETMELYAPVASRLGIWQIGWQMEDLAFRQLHNRRYRDIVHLVASQREQREKYIAHASRILQDELKNAGIEAEVTGRPKHIYGIHHKMQRYTEQGKEFSDIYDLSGIRILVNKVSDCYNTLAVIHGLWHSLPNEFNDYIAQPRGGVYQSLHTTVMCMGTTPLEIQIRTHDMHRVAEYGVAAHWRYKEEGKGDTALDQRFAALRQLLELYQGVGGKEFLESIGKEVFSDLVLVYTPKGEIKDLPAGATPLDFAYHIHTDLGHRCTGAKVNRKMVPLTYHLQNGDTVEILTVKGDKGPSRDWLNPDLGYLQTSHAREKVRQWFRKQERGSNIQHGRELLSKELPRLGISTSEQELADLFQKESVDDFLAAIGSGDVSIHQIVGRLAVPEEKPIPEVAPPKKKKISSGIRVAGMEDMLTHLSPCCNPMPGDKIIGYVTRSNGVSVHRRDCRNIVNVDEPERLINVDWTPREKEQLYSVPVRVEATDRVGLLRDISAVVAEDGVNITAASTADNSNAATVITLTLETKGLSQLSRLLSRLQGVSGVVSAKRIT
jgi:guanosine-3',5'-bis(diphosphate) 3'-pyrophosphohydrolase